MYIKAVNLGCETSLIMGHHFFYFSHQLDLSAILYPSSNYFLLSIAFTSPQLHPFTMTEQLNLFCLVDGEPTSRAFPINASLADTVGNLKDHIKAKNAVDFSDVDANKLTLWKVSIPMNAAKKHDAVILDSLDSKEELFPSDELSDIFGKTPPKGTAHIIVQRPPPGKGTLCSLHSLRTLLFWYILLILYFSLFLY